MKSRWIVHEGKSIFISDFSNLGLDAVALQQECDAIKNALVGQPPKSVTAIINLDGTFMNDGLVKAFKDILPVTNKYVRRRAVIGLRGFRKNFIFLFTKFVGDANIEIFDTLNEALNWAVKN